MRSTRLQRTRIFMLAFSVALGLTACGGSTTADADQPKLDLFVGTQPFGTIFVAQHKGFFEAEGVNVRVQRFSSGTEATEAFRTAKAGLFVAGDMPSILAWEHGDVVGIAPISADTTTFSLVVGKGIEAPKDLRGKKIATVAGSTGDIFIRSFLEKNQMTPDDVELLNLGPGDMAAALARGDISAFAWLGGEVGKGVEAADGAKILQKGTEGYVVNHIILSATKSSLEEADAIQGVIRALKRAQDLVRNDPDEAVKAIVKVTGMSEATARSDIERITYDMTFTAEFVKEMREISSHSEKAGFVKKPLDMMKSFDVSFLKAVDSGLVEEAK